MGMGDCSPDVDRDAEGEIQRSHSAGSHTAGGWESLMAKHKRDPSLDFGQMGLHLSSITGVFSLL